MKVMLTKKIVQNNWKFVMNNLGEKCSYLEEIVFKLIQYFFNYIYMQVYYIKYVSTYVCIFQSYTYVIFEALLNSNNTHSLSNTNKFFYSNLVSAPQPLGNIWQSLRYACVCLKLWAFFCYNNSSFSNFNWMHFFLIFTQTNLSACQPFVCYPVHCYPAAYLQCICQATRTVAIARRRVSWWIAATWDYFYLLFLL